MNTKILIPTDLSINSKAAIRFAIQLASQNKSSLIFYHCTHFLKPSRWSSEKYESYLTKELEFTRNNLFKFINETYKKLGIAKAKFEYIVQQGSDLQQSIINYAIKTNSTYICMSTRGAGRFKKIIGTNASGILTKSPIPVFIIPETYRRTPITNILYSSDLDNLSPELKLVKNFAKTLKAKIAVYHYDNLMEVDGVKKERQKAVKRFISPGIKFIFRKLSIEQSLAQHLINDVRKSKASLAVLFTNQHRDWFNKLFLSSKSADISFATKAPLLVFPKKSE